MNEHNQTYSDLNSDEEESQDFYRFKRGLASLLVGGIIAASAFGYGMVEDHKKTYNHKHEISQYVEASDYKDNEKETLEIMLDVLYSSKQDKSDYEVSYNLAIHDMLQSYGDKEGLVNFVNENLSKASADFFGNKNYNVERDEISDFYQDFSENSGYKVLSEFILENVSYLNE
ncbi:MAG: hypothetical protein ACOCP8_06445 [archaeon]